LGMSLQPAREVRGLRQQINSELFEDAMSFLC